METSRRYVPTAVQSATARRAPLPLADSGLSGESGAHRRLMFAAHQEEQQGGGTSTSVCRPQPSFHVSDNVHKGLTAGCAPLYSQEHTSSHSNLKATQACAKEGKNKRWNLASSAACVRRAARPRGTPQSENDPLYFL